MKTTLTITIEWWDETNPTLPIPEGWRESLAQDGYECAWGEMRSGFKQGELSIVYDVLPHQRIFKGKWCITEVEEY